MFELQKENVVRIVDTEAKRDKLLAQGFKPRKAAPAAEKALDDMTVPELKALASNMGLVLDEKAKKADIIAAIKGANPAGAGENKEDGAGK